MYAIDEASLINHARGAVAVTPSDTVALATESRWLYIGTGGSKTLKVTMANGDVVSFGNVSSGDLLPLRVTLVWATGTSATNIVALY